MNLDNASFICLNRTPGDFNESELAEMALSSFAKFYLKYGLLLLALHRLLGNTISLACLTEVKNSETFLILLRLLSIINILVSSTFSQCGSLEK
ncbi:unnamed protein product [Gordionus sp. m RMFG-2023]